MLGPKATTAGGLLLLAALITGCGEASSSSSAAPTTATPTPKPSPGHGSPDAAMAGFLQAASSSSATSSEVEGWLMPAPSKDRATIEQVSQMNQMLGLSGSLFWEVSKLQIVSSKTTGSSGEVTLSGDIVWCTGSGPTDAKASCAQPSGVTGKPHTYPMSKASDGQWYLDMDINNGQLLRTNPQQ
jgi:hypothetical protein